MKRNDWLLLGGVAVALWYFTKKKPTSALDDVQRGIETPGGLLGQGSLTDVGYQLSNLLSAFSGQNQSASPAPTLADYQSANMRGGLPYTAAALTQRWTPSPTATTTPSTGLAGITNVGAYNPAALQASPVAALTSIPAAVTELASFASSSGGSVGTAYSAGSAIPVALVPSGGAIGVYTTLDAYIAQATGKAPSKAAAAVTVPAANLTPAERMARGLW